MAKATDSEIRELIRAGHTDVKIAGMLKVGRDRIRRIRKQMQEVTKEDGNMFIERIENEEKAKNFDDVIDKKLKAIILNGTDETILKAVKEYRAGKEEEKAMNVAEKLSQMEIDPLISIDMEAGEHMVYDATTRSFRDAPVMIWQLNTPEEVAFFLHGNFGLLPLSNPIPQQWYTGEGYQSLSDELHGLSYNVELRNELAKVIKKYLNK